MSNIARKWESIPSIIKNTSTLWIPTEYILKRQYLARVWISGCSILGNKEWKCLIDLFRKMIVHSQLLTFPFFWICRKKDTGYITMGIYRKYVWFFRGALEQIHPISHIFTPQPGLWKGPTLAEVIGIDAGPGPRIRHGWRAFLLSNLHHFETRPIVKQARWLQPFGKGGCLDQDQEIYIYNKRFCDITFLADVTYDQQNPCFVILVIRHVCESVIYPALVQCVGKTTAVPWYQRSPYLSKGNTCSPVQTWEICLIPLPSGNIAIENGHRNSGFTH